MTIADLVQQILSSPDFLSFLVGYGTNAAWDASKATFAKLKETSDSDSSTADAFARLSANSALTRECQLVVADALRHANPDLASALNQDIDVVAGTVRDFILTEDQGNGSLIRQLRERLQSLVSTSGGLSDESIAFFVAQLLSCLAGRDRLSAAITHVGISKVHDLLEVGFKSVEHRLDALIAPPPTVTGEQVASSIVSTLPAAEEIPLTTDSVLSAVMRLSKIAAAGDELLVRNEFNPPVLPGSFVHRPAICQAMDEKLAQVPLVAIVGYPMAGKTSAVADYAARSESACCWLELPERIAGPADLQFVQLAFTVFLGRHGEADLLPHPEQMAEWIRTPVLVVLDEAQRLSSPAIVQYLRRLCDLCLDRLRVIFVFAEEAGRTQLATEQGVPVWRLPGFEAHEAAELLSRFGVLIDDRRLKAVRMLTSRYDGHIGVFRVAVSELQALTSDDKLAQFFGSVTNSGSSIAQLLNAMAGRLVNGLPDHQKELCERVSVIIGGFTLSIAQALWSTDRPTSEFAGAWYSCVSSIFEAVGDGQHRLPALYRERLYDMLPHSVARHLHRAAADSLLVVRAGVVDGRDVLDAVFHLVLAEEFDAALVEASRLLAQVMFGTRRDVRRLVYVQLRVYADSGILDRASPTPRLQFLAMLYAIAGRLKLDEHEELGRRLCTMLVGLIPEAATSTELAFAWAQGLLFASNEGDADFALKAIETIPKEWLKDVEADGISPLAIGALFAVLRSNADPLEAIERIFRQVEQGRLKASLLYGSGPSFEVWSALGHRIYAQINDLSSELERQRSLDRLDSIIELALRIEASKPAALLAAVKTTLQIDVLRDTKGALLTAQDLPQDMAVYDPRLGAHLAAVSGDALRCEDRLTDAAAAYRRAIELSPGDALREKAQALVSLAVTEFRLGNREGAYRTIRQGAAIARADKEIGSREWGGRVFFEAAALAIWIGRYRHALVWLCRAHEWLSDNRQNVREWPVLAQLAMQLAQVARGELSQDKVYHPGFTFGLPRVVEGADKMLPCAPEVALSHACHNLGFSRRAVAFCEVVHRLLPPGKLADLQAASTFQMSLGTNSVPTIALAGMRAAEAMPRVEAVARDESLGPGIGVRFLISSMIDSVVKAASSANRRAELQDATNMVTAYGNLSSPLTQLVATTITAVNSAVVNGDLTKTQECFRSVVDLPECPGARELAWFCALSFPAMHPALIGDTVQWHLRYLVLAEIAWQAEPDTLARALQQERDFWEHAILPGVDEVANSQLRQWLTSGEVSIRSLQAALVGLATSVVGTRDLLAELKTFTAIGRFPAGIERAYDKVLEFCLGGMLMPIYNSIRDDVVSTIEELRNLSALPAAQSQFNNLTADLSHLVALQAAVDTQQPTNDAAAALVALERHERQLMPYARATYFLFLIRMFRYSPVPAELASQVKQICTRPRITRLLETIGADVGPAMTASLTMAVLVNESLESLTKYVTQVTDLAAIATHGAPIGVDRIGELSQLVRERGLELQQFVDQFNVLEAQSLEAGNDDIGVQCVLNRSNLRLSMAAVELRANVKPRDQDATQELEIALRDLQDAAARVSDKDFHLEALCTARAACAARLLGRDVETASLVHSARAAARRASDARIASLIEEQIATDSALAESKNRDPFEPLADDEIEYVVDVMLRGAGLPADRRLHLLGDAKKLNRIREIQGDFCRHLEALQDLRHLRSNATAYAAPTEHVCRCAKLGYETTIQHRDIDVVVHAMQVTYCTGCPDREPGRRTAS